MFPLSFSPSSAGVVKEKEFAGGAKLRGMEKKLEYGTRRSAW